MEITDYKLEDLRIGDRLCNTVYNLMIQGIIGNCLICEVIYGDYISVGNVYSFAQLKDMSCKLIRPTKMNGDFEVGDYNDMPVVMYKNKKNNSTTPVFLLTVTEDMFHFKFNLESTAIGFDNAGKISKIKGIEYKVS